MPDENDKPRGGGEGYRGDTSGGYGTGGAASDFEDVTGRKDVKLEDVFPEDAKRLEEEGRERAEDGSKSPEARSSE